jgi:HEAT repeat protein
MTDFETLIAQLAATHWRVRRQATEELGNLGDVRAVVPLIAALRDADADVWRWAQGIGGVGSIGSGSANTVRVS